MPPDSDPSPGNILVQNAAPVPLAPDAATPDTAERESATHRPVPAIQGYRLPGEGASTWISVITVIALFALWWVATHYGWIKDLFLPTPERIVTSFADAWKGDIQGGKPLSEHF